VLNAKQHEREAHIVAQPPAGAVTIATNMAVAARTSCSAATSRPSSPRSIRPTAPRGGRRADWQQRHEHVVAAGGLHIVGTSATSRGASTTSCATLGPPGRPGL